MVRDETLWRPQTIAATTLPLEHGRIALHRREARLRPQRIDVRPSREAIAAPLIGVLFGAACFAAIVVLRDTLPVVLLAGMLLVAVIALPLAGMGLVYSLIGANVVIDQRKNSVVFQQGVAGLGVGTREVVPFEKIAELVIEEAGQDDSDPLPTEELTQWQLTLVKTNGKRLPIAGMTSLRAYEMDALQPVVELGRAVATLTGKDLVLPDVEGL
ncbi:MAG TPA: hypothetical protein VNL92_03700 [Dehalococcoidia bacterium]|nr:hypothetical protein [Dehalococcoidia bacterium]